MKDKKFGADFQKFHGLATVETENYKDINGKCGLQDFLEDPYTPSFWIPSVHFAKQQGYVEKVESALKDIKAKIRTNNITIG